MSPLSDDEIRILLNPADYRRVGVRDQAPRPQSDHIPPQRALELIQSYRQDYGLLKLIGRTACNDRPELAIEAIRPEVGELDLIDPIEYPPTAHTYKALEAATTQPHQESGEFWVKIIEI